MRRLVFDGHYGQRVEIDRCAPCHLVWFDSVESVRLSGTGMLGLLRDMADAQREAHIPLKADARCPRCAGTLKTVHNQSRWGPTLQLECRVRHGGYQTFAQFLSEKGLVRRLGAAERATLSNREDGLSCLNCGAAIGASHARCTYCDSLPGLVDIARRARARDPAGAAEAMRVPGLAPRTRRTSRPATDTLCGAISTTCTTS